MAKEKKINGKAELERLNKIIDELNDTKRDYERSKLEKAAGCKLYDAEQMADQFDIKSIQLPYWYAVHRKSKEAATLMKVITKPVELWKVERSGREALKAGRDRYSRKKELKTSVERKINKRMSG